MGKKEKNGSSFRKKLLVVGIVFIFLVLLIASFFGKRGWVEVYHAQKKKKALLEEIASLEQKKNKLLREIEELKKNPKAVEKKAREKLWLMKPDEKVIIIE